MAVGNINALDVVCQQ